MRVGQPDSSALPACWQPAAPIFYDTPAGLAYDGTGLMISPFVMARAKEVID